MRRILSALSLTLALVACTPSTPIRTGTSSSSAAPSVLSMTFSQSAQPSQQSQTLSMYSLTLEGPVNETVRLGSTTADAEVPLKLVPSKAYKGTKVQQGFESYFAGGGMQVAVFRDGDTLSIKKRETSEQGDSPASACGDWQTIATYTVLSTTTIAWKNLPDSEANAVIGCAW